MQNIVVLGAGISGVGAAILAKQKGLQVFVSDFGAISEENKKMLEHHQIPWEENKHTEERILEADVVIKSPGIPKKAPILTLIHQNGIPVISEIEFAGRYLTKAKIIAVTGSNGKTTTTSLIYHLLVTAGYNVGLGGNIGKSLALELAQEEEKEYYVLELSSFQLEDMFDFSVNIAVLLNITPDHLDQYDYQMQPYVDAKMRIFQNQTKDDFCITWTEDPIVKKELLKYDGLGRRETFSEVKTDKTTAYFLNGNLVSGSFEYPFERMKLRGIHNIRNVLAAILSVQAVGITNEDLAKGLDTFNGVPHRLEYVGCRDGVHYINDSKATNVDACFYALESMTGSTILILGGLDKGNDYDQIKELVKKKCKALVFLGVDNEKLISFFQATEIPYYDTHSMKECVEICKKIAVAGDAVLLSPCCASFDLFKNMADRGNQFKAYVNL